MSIRKTKRRIGTSGGCLILDAQAHSRADEFSPSKCIDFVHFCTASGLNYV